MAIFRVLQMQNKPCMSSKHLQLVWLISFLSLFALQIDPVSGMVINLTDLKEHMQVIVLHRWQYPTEDLAVA